MKNCILKSILLLTILCLLLAGCTVDNGDECQDTKASPINVNIRIYVHNLARNDNNVSIHIDKVPCGEAPKGQFDLSGFANNFGDYESIIVNYNLSNSNDKVDINYEYALSEYHGNIPATGNLVLKYDDLAEYDGSTCVVDLEYSETIHELWTAWTEHMSRMTYCYDLPYFMLFGYPPVEGEDALVTKNTLYQKMIQMGYQKKDEGMLNSSLYVEEGDIILFGTTSLPDPSNAQHYAVVIGGEIWEILHWDPYGGQFDGPRDPVYFLNRPKMMNPYTGNEEEPVVPFLYYTIFNK
jgi:hypothetical protein